MDKLACFFMTARSISDIRDRMGLAESLGFDAAGLPQIAARDPMTTLAAVAPTTEKIRLGTGIVPIWTRTPVALAQEAAVVQEAASGRFILGVGVGHRILVESWHGSAFHQPLQAMREYLTILRKLFKDGSVDFQGEIFKTSFTFMGYQPQPVPLYVAALGPKMAQLAGEMADGVILWLSSPRHIKDVVIPNIEIGARRAGRSMDEIEIFGCLFAAPSENRPAARDAIRMQLLTYLQLPFYRAVMDSAGFSDDLTAFDSKLKEGLIPDALASLSDRLIDEIAATGTPQEIAETLERFVTAGCSMPGVGVVGGYEGYPGTESALTMLSEARSILS